MTTWLATLGVEGKRYQDELTLRMETLTDPEDKRLWNAL